MSDYVIIPDSSCDLTEDLRDRFGIPEYLKGIIYFPDGHEELCDLDWTNISAKEYYDSMKGRKVLYKTSTPSIGSVYETFEKYLKQGIDILCISLSSGLSTSYANTVMVAEDLIKKYPDRKVVCIDSKRYSTSLALLVLFACQLKESGKSIEEVKEILLTARNNIHQIGPMDDLFFLVKTGRVSNFKAFFGQMINLNLLADFNSNGMAEVIGKCKGKINALNASVEYMKKTIQNPEEQIIFIAHTNREEAANVLAEKIKAEFNPKEIIITTVGMACGASIGPGLCAAFYFGKEISSDNAQEKVYMAEILEKQLTK